MKILFLLKSHKYSGAENVILTLMQLLPKEYETVYASPDGPIREAVTSNGQRFMALAKPNLSSVKKAITTFKPDIIHASDFSMSILATYAAPKIPIISHLHNNPTWIKNKFDPRTLAYKFALRRIRRVICVSSAIIEEFQSKTLHDKAAIIPNIVDHQKVITLSNKFNVEEHNDICFVGRLTSQKNSLFFCEIVKGISQIDPNVKAIMIGQGELKTVIEKYIKENNLQQNIEMLGFQQNPYPYMKSAKIGMMPSKFEGFGLVAVEMLTLGKPVIASAVGGLKDIINNSCGQLISRYNVNDYVQAYLAMINSQNYGEKAKNAKIVAQQYADTNHFMKQFISIYREVSQ